MNIKVRIRAFLSNLLMPTVAPLPHHLSQPGPWMAEFERLKEARFFLEHLRRTNNRVVIGSNYPPMRDPEAEAAQAAQLARYEVWHEQNRAALPPSPVPYHRRAEYAQAAWAYTPTPIEIVFIWYSALMARGVHLLVTL